MGILSPLTSIMLSAVFGVAITWVGLGLTLVGTGRYLPASFYIATLATCTYFGAVVVSRWRVPQRADQG